MIPLPKPDVILTHESDLDGLVSGLLLQKLARKQFNAHVPVEAHHYQSWKMRNMRERAAWVADFAFDDRLDRAQWVIIDHHPFEEQPKYAHLIHDPAKSAGALCYQLCQEQGLGSPVLDRLVRLNDVADLFWPEDPDFVLANDYANLVKTYGFWNLHAIIDGEIERLVDHPLLEVMAVKRRIEDPLGYDWSVRNVVELTPQIGLVETVVGNNNLIVHRLLREKATPFTVLGTLFRKGNGQMILSLRSRNGEAVQVAERLQGGGHPNASGAVLPRSIRSREEALPYLRQVLNPSVPQQRALNSMEELFSGLNLDAR